MSPSNPSPLFASLHYLTIEVDFGLCEIQVGRGLGARVSGEGKVEGLSWKRESVLESGIARKRGKRLYGFWRQVGWGTGLLQGLKGNFGEEAKRALTLSFSFHFVLARKLVISPNKVMGVGFVCQMAEIGCSWARLGPSKSSQSLSIDTNGLVVID
ncbi:hypothetical protein Tco_0724824 [Tanacetum coccineum]|uniref:Uncharacterized protein n=1 Tax=Tanacetum coccineum TaxID=301880 RepID=A0ABQ4YDD9_9ASTR